MKVILFEVKKLNGTHGWKDEMPSAEHFFMPSACTLCLAFMTFAMNALLSNGLSVKL